MVMEFIIEKTTHKILTSPPKKIAEKRIFFNIESSITQIPKAATNIIAAMFMMARK